MRLLEDLDLVKSLHHIEFTEAQRNHCTYDRELLAAYYAIKHFRHTLEGRNFIIYTDPKSLSYAAEPGQHLPDNSPCLTILT